MNSKEHRQDRSDVSIKTSPLSRREWLQKSMMSAVFLAQGFPGGQGGWNPQGGWGGRGGRQMRPRRVIDPSTIPAFKHKTLPVGRFKELQKEFDAARENSQMGTHKLYLDEINNLNFKIPADFPDAKSIVIVSTFSRNMHANFHLDGETYKILIPFYYHREDLNADTLKGVVEKDIVKTPGRRIVDVSSKVPLKLLAARSGLGRYARNGLVFVDEMGSYITLFAFLTDHPFTEDPWTELEILQECNRCHACERTCPTRCINRWNYTPNMDKCLALYNENPGDFPNFIQGSMHHALMGCMQCKTPCPVNDGLTELPGDTVDITEEETKKILKGTPDDVLMKSLKEKLKDFRPTLSEDQFQVLKRNLNVLIRT